MEVYHGGLAWRSSANWHRYPHQCLFPDDCHNMPYGTFVTAVAGAAHRPPALPWHWIRLQVASALFLRTFVLCFLSDYENGLPSIDQINYGRLYLLGHTYET